MATHHDKPRLNLVGRILKAVGTVTDPARPTGKAFTAVEDIMTRAIARVATNDTYLSQAGKAMDNLFTLHRTRNRLMERLLQLWRVPTLSDVESIQAELGRVRGQVEALGYQIEYLIEALEKQNNRVEQLHGR